MPKSKGQKQQEEYRKTRTQYLQDRVKQTQDKLRAAGLTSEQKKSLQDKLKSYKDNLLKIKTQSKFKETAMSSLADKYRASVVKITAASKDLTPQEMHDKLVARLKVLGERLKNAKTRKDKAVIPHIEKLIGQVEEAKKECEDKIAASKSKKRSPATSANAGFRGRASSGSDAPSKSKSDSRSEIEKLEDELEQARSEDGGPSPRTRKLSKQLEELKAAKKSAPAKKAAPSVGGSDIEKAVNAAEADYNKRGKGKSRYELPEALMDKLIKVGLKPSDVMEDLYDGKSSGDILENVSFSRSSRGTEKPAAPAKKAVPTKKPAAKPESKGFQQTILDAWGGDENAMRALHNNGIDIKDVTKDILSGANEWTAMRQIKKSMGDREFDYNAKDAPGLEKAITKYKSTVETKNNTRGQGRAGGKGDDTHKPTSRPVSGTKKPTSTRKPIDKVKALKRQAQTLTGSGINAADRSAILDKIAKVYDSMTPEERKASELTTFMTGQNLKLLGKKSENVSTMLAKNKSELLSAGDVRNNFAKDAKAAKVAQSRKAAPAKPAAKKPAAKKEIDFEDLTPAEKKVYTNYNKLVDKMTATDNPKVINATKDKLVELLKSVSPTSRRKLGSMGHSLDHIKKQTQFSLENSESRAKKAAPAKPAATKPAANLDANGKRYTKRGVTTMLKELREAQEKGRKGSSAAKKRDEDIKRLSKILKTLSSLEGNAVVASVADNFRISTIAAYMEEGSKLVATAATENEIVNEIARSTKSQIRKGRRPKLITKSPITEESLIEIGNQLIRKGPFKLQLDELLMKDSDDEFSIHLTWVPDDQDEDENEVLVSIDQDGEIHINYG